ncbi:Cyclopropane-fatty-acyl-phospholipid synthase [Brevundimonas diminuta]|uniref:SAM-dependent methyltransferase n=1 Tax=Brevundimonas diminuta TaxID=293 RepID=UPI000207F17F|nr:cyclopropane-fatty-acyl-phospholipid synthase family protein [Brevundimonas diminuta]EGF95317.1 cyclopropane-fatty-acyl-phospholipid synthase family protein [Brevundimonas diminuta ATCC 11568]OWR22438.1 SAM-dependent methyltransferase [Brevundimonas diminuta]WQE45903.1 cyclopropane-fatty-acyl-phospholipid synthase family protein [Brevundimonas diminuta]SPU47098.1 Cyclopropane-fatty-acyl-phospholipid synthase [Brevundimonas diminuta]SUW15132.1 Cyclopropane-fatty-acyl-phospholipid synthase [B
MLQALLDRTFQTRSIRVRLPDGRELTAGPGEPELTAVLSDMKTAVAIAANPDLALGEAFMDGTFRIEGGSVYDFLQLTTSQLALRPRSPKLTWVQRIRRGAEQANDRLHARSNVHHHYDLTVDFYRLFLDDDLQYSCAFFETSDASLEEAQVAKKRRLIDKLLLEPGHSALDIGAGWGGLGLSMVERGARVTGVTLSTEQHRTANERATALGVTDRADFRLQDYRDLNQTFDRIISVGMFEHVGVPNYQEYFDTVARLLDDDGVAVIHSIGRKSPPNRTQPWVRKYIFPGGYIPALSEVLPAIERAGLWVTDMEVLRLHYAETLRHWRERFLARRGEALAMYDERFCRMWEFYLAASEVAFRELGHMVFQLQLTKKQTAAPLSRDYLCG